MAVSNRQPPNPEPDELLTTGENIFDTAFLRQLEALDAALLRLRGSSGEGARGHGRSHGQTEFRGHRPYSQGDDLRRLDWNAYGRLGKYFMREYELEQAEHVTLLLDCSRSMAAGKPAKHVLARRSAAAFGYLALKRGGTATLAGQPGVEGIARFSRLLEQLTAAEPVGDMGIGPAAAALAARGKAPADLVVITDGLEPLEAWRGLQSLSERRSAITLLQILAPDELEPPAGAFVLRGLEEHTSFELDIDASIQQAYRIELEKHLAAREAMALRHGWALALTDSAADLRELFIGKLLPAGATP